MFRLAQLAKELAAQVVVVEEDDSSDESSDDEDFPELRALRSGSVSTHRGEPKRRVTFKDDSENLMKPPVRNQGIRQGAASQCAISDDDEEGSDSPTRRRLRTSFKPSASAWRAKAPPPKDGPEQHDELLAIWREDYAASDWKLG